MKKIWKIIISIVLLIILLFFPIIIILHKPKGIDVYSKYTMSISIMAINKDHTTDISLNINTDDNNSEITSTFTKQAIYIIDNKMYISSNNKLLINRIDTSYNRLNDIISNINRFDIIEEHSNITECTALLSESTINKILESLFIDTKVDKSQIINFNLINRKINTLNISLENTTNFDKINIIVNFSELKEDYNIDTNKALGLENGRIKHYSIEESKENPLEIK